MRTDAIIFDMDGTIWDSSETVVKAWNNVLEKRSDIKSGVTSSQLKSLMGLPLNEIGDRLFPYIEKSERDSLMKECCQYECEVLSTEGGVLFDGLEETLTALQKKMKLLIVSNCQSGYIEAFYKYHKLDKYFSDFECAGNTGKSKGQNIIEVVRRNKIKSAYYVGDTQTDYLATRKACVPFVYASYGFGSVHTYEYIIESPRDLIEMF